MSGVATAQQPPDQAPAQQAESASNVTPYKPPFFAQFRPNTAMDMVDRLPGFSFDGGSDARGFSGTGGNVLIDGERAPSRGDDLRSVISRIPAGGVERIDVIRGGAEGIDMQGKPVVANIIRKKDAGVTGSISSNVNVNAFGGVSPNATLALRNQSGGQLLDGSIGIFRNQGNATGRRWRVTPSGTVTLIDPYGTNNVFDDFQATGAWETLWLGGKLRINGRLEVGHFDGFQQDNEHIPGGIKTSDTDELMPSGEAGIRYVRTMPGGWQMELVGFQSLKTDDNTNDFVTQTDAFHSDSDTDSGESIARTVITLPAMGEWTFNGGVEGVFNFQESTNFRSQNGVPVSLAGDTSRGEELRGELFGTATWAPSSTLSVETGVRLEASKIEAKSNGGDSSKSFAYLKPRLNVSWTPEKGHQWGLQIERVVDQLDFGTFQSTADFENSVFGVGNPAIEPQKNWVIDARYERQFGGQNSIVLKYNHTTIEDFLGRTIATRPSTSSTAEVTQNTGTATRDSISLNSSFELDRFGMPGGIFVFGADLRDSHVTDPVTLEERKLSNDSTWSWNTSLSQTLDGGNFRWGVYMEKDADQPFWNPRSYGRNHGGLFLGTNFSWKPAPNWTVGGGVNGITAEDNHQYLYFYNAPRDTGTILYRQDQTFESRRQFFVNARVNF